jgi:exodeoxyribonuclease-5
MQLTEEQKEVVRGIIKALSNNQVISFGGLAGVGKTTVCKTILQALAAKNLQFCAAAYTGKATNVLRKKGIAANTIHSCIYSPIIDPESEEVIWMKKSAWEMKDQIDGFLIDEASMVSRDIHNDLVSYGLPIIYVGDHGQLEPIGSKFNLMENPMFRLETVHRNAGEIAHFAQHLRQGNKARSFDGTNKVQIISESSVEDRHLAAVDQIIVAFNKTRVALNHRVRKFKKIDASFIAKGEKIICLRNNKTAGLFNGMQGVVTTVRKGSRFDFVSDGTPFHSVSYDPDQFGKESYKFDHENSKNPFDYAYAITCHKAQGDQFGNVVVYEQSCDKWDHVRWCYTAASRAANGLIWISSAEYIPSYLE